MRRLILCSHIWLTIISLASVSAGKTSPPPLPGNEFIPYHPTGCRFIRKEQQNTFKFVQTCSRGNAGEWTQVIEALELATPGVLYIPKQVLVNGLEVSGYWCSGVAPRAFKEKAQTCTKSGWKKAINMN